MWDFTVAPPISPRSKDWRPVNHVWTARPPRSTSVPTCHVPTAPAATHRARPAARLVRGGVPDVFRIVVRVRVHLRALARDRARSGAGPVPAPLGAPGNGDPAAAQQDLS